MNFRVLACLALGTGLCTTAASGQDRNPAQPPPAPAPAPGRPGAADGIDQTIENYQARLARDADQARKEIAQLRAELTELIKLRYDAALSLADLQAEVGAAGGPAVPPATAVTNTLGVPAVPAAGAARPLLTGSARSHQKLILLNQELRQLQNFLRAEVQQARAATDQTVAQLNILRGQQRQRQLQLKVSEEMIRQERQEEVRERRQDSPK
jgi:hypothetical protein